MTTVKIAVSLPAEQVERARQAVADGSAPSVSAYVSRALAAQQERAGLAAYVDYLIEEFGPPTEEDERWADEAVALARRVAER